MTAVEIHFITGIIIVSAIVIVLSFFYKRLFKYTPLLGFMGGIWAIIPSIANKVIGIESILKSKLLNVFFLYPLIDQYFPKIKYLGSGRIFSFLFVLAYFNLFIAYYIITYKKKEK